MPLTVHLDNRQPLYAGDERITGKVIFQSPTAVNIDEISVTFSGRAKAKVQKAKGAAAPSTSYKSKCVLFEKKRILLHLAGNTLIPDTYEWPFEFTFPSEVRCDAKWPEALPFRSDANHPLPPTFAAEVGDSLRRLDCAIDYQVRAQVFKPQNSIFRKSPLFDEVLRLHVIPRTARLESNMRLAPYQACKEQLFTVRSLLLLPENRGRSLKFQEKMQSWLSPSQLPRFDFQASLSYSTRVVQSMPLDCVLKINPLMEYSSVSIAPDIVLQSVSITVVGRTAARTAPSLIGSMSGEIDERIEVLCKNSVGLPVSGEIDLGRVFGPLVLKSMDVSFSTFNIARLYRICASFSFECAGKTLEFSLTDLPIVIVSGASLDGEKSGMLLLQSHRQELAGSSAAANEAHDEAPPSYTSGSDLSVATLEKASS